MVNIINLFTRNKLSHCGNSINKNKNRIFPSLSPWQTNTNSIEISNQGLSGIGKGLYKACGFTFDLPLSQVMQFSQNFYT